MENDREWEELSRLTRQVADRGSESVENLVDALVALRLPRMADAVPYDKSRVEKLAQQGRKR